MRTAAWLRPAIHLSRRTSYSCPPSLGRLVHQFSGASPRSPSASPGWWQRSASWIPRFSPLHVHVPARSYRSGLARDRDRPGTTKRHLYVVLENHRDNGFEIQKLDMDDGDGDSGSTPRRLPEPVVRGGIRKSLNFAALGSTIIAMDQGTRPGGGATIIYDTKTAELATSNLLPRGLISGCDLAVAVGNRLCAFESQSDNFRCARCNVCFPGGLHCLRAADDHPNDAAADDYKRWNWRLLPGSPRYSWSGSDSSPPELPFDAESITAHAVHPRGRTIFVSAGGWRVDVGTFTYGTGSGKWKRRSDWVLPFIGPAHYDVDLDAWVGLHRADARDDDGSETTDGHLCACRVMSAASASRQPPEWKVSGETLFREDLGRRRGKVQLVYMGRRSEYCLVEHLRACDDERESYVLRLTVFRARYGEDGELTTTVDRPARSYEVPGDYDRCFDAQAFWM